MRAPPTREPDGAAAVRVLVPYILTHGGGVRSVLRAALPRLSARPDVQLTYAELCRNDTDMDALEREGVRVDRDAGLPGPAALSRRAGWRRALDLAGQALRLLRLARRLSRRLGAYDVCWVHGHRELLLAIAARALAGSRTPAIVWHWHGPPLSLSAGARGSRAGRVVARLGALGCARVIAISEFCARQTALMGVAPRRVVTVLNAASAGGTRAGAPEAALPARPAGAFVSLVACAALRPHKGVHLAVQALRHLPANHVLWVTGDPGDPGARGYVAELRKAAAEAGAEERLWLLGARRDVHRVMSHADVVVVPSVWEEPFGLVAAEAQLLGVPVIASRRGALPELVRYGELGLVFDPEDPRALAAAVLRLAEDPAERARLAEAARRQAPRRYGCERWCDEVVAVLRGVARRTATDRDRVSARRCSTA